MVTAPPGVTSPAIVDREHQLPVGVAVRRDPRVADDVGEVELDVDEVPDAAGDGRGLEGGIVVGIILGDQRDLNRVAAGVVEADRIRVDHPVARKPCRSVRLLEQGYTPAGVDRCTR